MPSTNDSQTEAFAQNVSRAHLLAAIWRSPLSPHPPSVEVTQYGWSKDEASKTLIPVTTPSDIVLVPPYILQMIRCGCASDEPCLNAQCGCDAAHLPCKFFCSCSVGIHSTKKPRKLMKALVMMMMVFSVLRLVK